MLQTFTFHCKPVKKELVSKILKLSAFLIFVSVLQQVACAQDESVPQTRLSSKGLAYVNLSTSPANPVTGQLTIILLQFVDPETKAPLGDIYYRFIIRNDTNQIFVVPDGSTISGKVGIPYQFDSPGKYQVEVDLNDTAISDISAPVDEVTFPIYVDQGEPQDQNQTVLNSTNLSTAVNTESDTNFESHLLIYGVLGVVIAAGLIFLIIRKKAFSGQKKSNQ